jgi:hypothetical protein
MYVMAALIHHLQIKSAGQHPFDVQVPLLNYAVRQVTG